MGESQKVSGVCMCMHMEKFSGAGRAKGFLVCLPKRANLTLSVAAFAFALRYEVEQGKKKFLFCQLSCLTKSTTKGNKLVKSDQKTDKKKHPA